MTTRRLVLLNPPRSGRPVQPDLFSGVVAPEQQQLDLFATSEQAAARVSGPTPDFAKRLVVLQKQRDALRARGMSTADLDAMIAQQQQRIKEMWQRNPRLRRRHNPRQPPGVSPAYTSPQYETNKMFRDASGVLRPIRRNLKATSGYDYDIEHNRKKLKRLARRQGLLQRHDAGPIREIVQRLHDQANQLELQAGAEKELRHEQRGLGAIGIVARIPPGTRWGYTSTGAKIPISDWHSPGAADVRKRIPKVFSQELSDAIYDIKRRRGFADDPREEWYEDVHPDEFRQALEEVAHRRQWRQFNRRLGRQIGDPRTALRQAREMRERAQQLERLLEPRLARWRELDRGINERMRQIERWNSRLDDPDQRPKAEKALNRLYRETEALEKEQTKLGRLLGIKGETQGEEEADSLAFNPWPPRGTWRRPVTVGPAGSFVSTRVFGVRPVRRGPQGIDEAEDIPPASSEVDGASTSRLEPVGMSRYERWVRDYGVAEDPRLTWAGKRAGMALRSAKPETVEEKPVDLLPQVRTGPLDPRYRWAVRTYHLPGDVVPWQKKREAEEAERLKQPGYRRLAPEPGQGQPRDRGRVVLGARYLAPPEPLDAPGFQPHEQKKVGTVALERVADPLEAAMMGYPEQEPVLARVRPVAGQRYRLVGVFPGEKEALVSPLVRQTIPVRPFTPTQSPTPFRFGEYLVEQIVDPVARAERHTREWRVWRVAEGQPQRLVGDAFTFRGALQLIDPKLADESDRRQRRTHTRLVHEVTSRPQLALEGVPIIPDMVVAEEVQRRLKRRQEQRSPKKEVPSIPSLAPAPITAPLPPDPVYRDVLAQSQADARAEKMVRHTITPKQRRIGLPPPTPVTAPPPPLSIERPPSISPLLDLLPASGSKGQPRPLSLFGMAEAQADSPAFSMERMGVAALKLRLDQLEKDRRRLMAEKLPTGPLDEEITNVRRQLMTSWQRNPARRRNPDPNEVLIEEILERRHKPGLSPERIAELESAVSLLRERIGVANRLKQALDDFNRRAEMVPNLRDYYPHGERFAEAVAAHEAEMADRKATIERMGRLRAELWKDVNAIISTPDEVVEQPAPDDRAALYAQHEAAVRAYEASEPVWVEHKREKGAVQLGFNPRRVRRLRNPLKRWLWWGLAIGAAMGAYFWWRQNHAAPEWVQAEAVVAHHERYPSLPGEPSIARSVWRAQENIWHVVVRQGGVEYLYAITPGGNVQAL